MKLLRMLLGTALFAGLVGLAYVSQQDNSVEARMASAAESFLQTLSDEQRQQATFAFDDKERTNWNFVPLQTADKKPTRKGLPLQNMNDKQRKAALDLVRASLSDKGYTQATTIMSLESILKALEAGGAMVRNPDWYFFTIFGKPARNGKWGWRIEGHHLSLNFTMEDGKLISSTPAFFGANPATVMTGPKKDLQTLADVEKLSRALIASLDEAQSKAARQAKPLPEPVEKSVAPTPGEPVGLSVAKFTDKQKETLVKLLETYARRMPDRVASEQMKRVKDAGLDKIHFAYSEDSDKKGKPYTYRLHGPTFLVEFLNTQTDPAKNPANHIHSCWRSMDNDFGLTARRP